MSRILLFSYVTFNEEEKHVEKTGIVNLGSQVINSAECVSQIVEELLDIDIVDVDQQSDFYLFSQYASIFYGGGDTNYTIRCNWSYVEL